MTTITVNAAQLADIVRKLQKAAYQSGQNLYRQNHAPTKDAREGGRLAHLHWCREIHNAHRDLIALGLDLS